MRFRQRGANESYKPIMLFGIFLTLVSLTPIGLLLFDSLTGDRYNIVAAAIVAPIAAFALGFYWMWYIVIVKFINIIEKPATGAKHERGSSRRNAPKRLYKPRFEFGLLLTLLSLGPIAYLWFHVFRGDYRNLLAATIGALIGALLVGFYWMWYIVHTKTFQSILGEVAADAEEARKQTHADRPE